MLRKDGWQREIRLFRYSTRPDTTGVVDPSTTSTPQRRALGLLTNYAMSLSRNVERFEPGEERRKAVEAEWKAILMLDDEIRKLQPNYHWYSTAIQDALKERNALSR
jgi:hypothetical protein